jgi:putative copper export protein
VTDPAVLFEGGAKALLYAALLLAIGSSAARWLLPGERALAGVALIAGCLATAAVLLRVWTHTFAVFGFDGARSWDSLTLIAFRSRWGQSWRFQAVAAAVYLLASAVTVWRRALWPAATIAALAFTVSVPFLGHAAGDAVRMAVHILHILAAGAWLGTLAVVVLLPVPRETRLLTLRRFAPIALPAAATVSGAGLVMSWFYLGGLSNLWTTPYGQILVLKVSLVLGIAVCGYVNMRRLRALAERSSWWTIALETALAAAVVIVTGYLTETGHPS